MFDDRTNAFFAIQSFTAVYEERRRRRNAELPPFLDVGLDTSDDLRLALTGAESEGGRERFQRLVGQPGKREIASCASQKRPSAPAHRASTAALQASAWAGLSM